MKRVLLSAMLVNLLAFNAGAEEGSGVIKAIASVSESGTAEITNMKSALPNEVEEQLRPAFIQHAQKQYAADGSEGAAAYHLAMDWEIVGQDGQEKLTFGWHESTDVVPVKQVQPLLPKRLAQRGGKWTILLDFSITETGKLENIRWANPQNGLEQLFEITRSALQQWRMKPTYRNGIAVERDIKGFKMEFET